MKRKTSTAPTKIYTYGCLPPVEGAAEFDEQLFRAHRYRNSLVEIERRRRDRITQVQRDHDILGDLLEVAHSTETMVAEARRETKLLRSGKGDSAAVAAQRELIEAALADLAVLKFLLARARFMLKVDDDVKERLALVEEAKTSPSLIRYVKPWQRLGAAVYAAITGDAGVRLYCEYAAVDDQASEEKRNARGASGLASGTYLVVEKASETWRAAFDPPRFLRYEGEGRIAVQLKNGTTTAEVESCQDTRLRIGPATPRVNKAGRVQTAVRPEFRTVWIRVGSDGRTPVWTKLPIVMHRPLPEDAKIMWAWIIRRRVGVRYKYELQLTVEAESFASTATRKELDKAVAIDIGARDLPTGEVRSALWLDSDGATGEVKSALTRLSSPTSRGVGRRESVPDNMTKVHDLRAIRDKNLDAIKSTIATYKIVAGASPASSVPDPALDWLRERAEYVMMWRSPARVALLYRNWQRHDGDVAVHEEIGAYLKQDRHLIDWESRERSRNLNRRRECYRTFAVRIAKQYATIVLAKRDYRRAEWVPEQAVSTRGTDSREIMRNVAPGELCEEIKRAAKSHGAKVIEVRLEGDTSWALDARVCERLFASAEAVTGQALPLASGKPQNHVGSIEPWKKRRLGTAERIDPLANEDVTG